MSWNKSDVANASENNSAKAKAAMPSSALKGLLALVIVCALGAGVFYFIRSADSGDDADADAKPDRIASVQPAQITKPKKSVSEPIAHREVSRTGDKVADALAEVNAIESLNIQAPPKKRAPAVKRTFKTGVEQLMSWVFTTELGDMPMPIPSLSDDDRNNLASILVSKNEITDDDSDMAAFCKETVDFAKQEMAKFVKDGGDPDDFLQYYFRELRKAFEIRNEAMNQVETLREESPELAVEFARKINERFAEEGIKLIPENEDEEE